MEGLHGFGRRRSVAGGVMSGSAAKSSQFTDMAEMATNTYLTLGYIATIGPWTVKSVCSRLLQISVGHDALQRSNRVSSTIGKKENID